MSETTPVGVGPIRTKLRDILANRLVADAVAQGVDKDKATSAVESIQSERPLIDFLLSVDWASLVQLIVKLAALL